MVSMLGFRLDRDLVLLDSFLYRDGDFFFSCFPLRFLPIEVFILVFLNELRAAPVSSLMTTDGRPLCAIFLFLSPFSKPLSPLRCPVLPRGVGFDPVAK